MASKRQLSILVLVVCSMLVCIGAVRGQGGPVHVTATSSDLLDVDIVFVGAHPDDDSVATATLARYVLDHGMKAAVITGTRGEGGGNAIGRELGPALGMLREAEERRALGALGIDLVFYLNELDWAFTTSANATEQFWGYEEPLSTLVRMFRVLKPDVVITMNPSPGSGHGHHQYVAKLATEAFWLAGDETAFPEQVSEEFLDIWQPKKLYYALSYGGAGLTPSLSIPSNEYSPSQYMSYAELETMALRNYRSQGFDSFATIPPAEWLLGGESFTLAASMLPVPEQETDLMAGLTEGVGSAPANVELIATPDEFYVSQGGEVNVTVEFRNESDTALNDLTLSLTAPDGWTVDDASEAVDVPVGEAASATFSVTIPDDADVSDLTRLLARFEATDENGDTRYATKPVPIRVTPPVTVELQPLQAVQIYRDWAERIGMENIVGLAQTEIAAAAGESGTIPVILTNRSNTDQEVTLNLSVDSPDVTVEDAAQTITVPAGESVTLELSAAIPADAAQSEFGLTAEISYGETTVSDQGTLQVVPTIELPMATVAPDIDGDLSEYEGLTAYDIPFDHLWEGETTDAGDLTGSFRASYDENFLYVALEVTDDVLVSNIAPNDIKGHWRSDSVEITIDPSGTSEHTLTTFKTGIFPFDTEGNTQAERDADANQGPIAITAPDMQFAAMRTDDGYTLEVAIPWNAVPGEVTAGQPFGFNVLLYDCDKAEAAVGENCNEARTAWSAWGQIQGNPRLWGRATLGE
jgi:LmbE family N-acetylglucosaminyl deacetylase